MWPQLEPLLAKVEKPARYIGCEDGAQRPDHAPRPGRLAADLPRHLRDRAAQPGPADPLRDPQRAARRGGRAHLRPVDRPRGRAAARPGLPLFSVDTHRPAGDFDVLAFNLSAELVYTNLLNCIDLAGVPVRAADRRPEHPLVGAGGHCTYNPEPLADFVDFVVLGDGEEVVSEITEVIGAWKAVGRTEGRREHVLRELAHVAGRLRAVDVRRHLRRRRPRGGHAPLPRRARPGREAHHRRPRRLAVPQEPARAAHRGRARPPQRRGLPGLHPGLPLLPGRHDHPPGARAPGRAGPHHGRRGPAAHRLRRGRPHLAVDRRLLAASRRSSATSCSRPDRRPPVSVSLPSLRVDAFTVGIAAQIQKARRTGLTFAPEAGTWRMRQVINKLIREEDLYGAVDSAYSQGWRRMKLYFLTGLPTETDEDTLGIAELARNVRRDRQGAPRKSPSVTVSRRRVRAQAVHAVPVVRPEHRRASCSARSTCCATTPAASHGRQPQVARPQGHLVEGLVSAAAIAASARSSRTSGGDGGTFQEWSEHFDLELWHEAMASHGLDIDWYVYRHRTEDEVLPWDHLVGRPPQGLPLAGLARRPRPRSASPTAAGRPATTAAPAPATPSSTSWPRPTPPAGGSQGTGQDLAVGGEVPVTPARSASPTPVGPGGGADEDPRSASPSWARSASPATATSPASGSGRCAGPSCPSPTPRASRPARRCTSGWPCPPATSRWASTSTSTSTDPDGGRRRSRRSARAALAAAPAGRRRRQPPPSIDRSEHRRCRRPSTAARGASRSTGPTPEALSAAVDALLAADRAPGHPRAQGQDGRRRHPSRHPRPRGRSAPTPRRSPSGRRARGRPGHPAPRACGPPSCCAGVRPAARRGPGASDPPMDHARRRDARAARAERAVAAPHAAGACVMRREPIHDRAHGQRTAADAPSEPPAPRCQPPSPAAAVAPPRTGRRPPRRRRRRRRLSRPVDGLGAAPLRRARRGTDGDATAPRRRRRRPATGRPARATPWLARRTQPQPVRRRPRAARPTRPRRRRRPQPRRAARTASAGPAAGPAAAERALVRKPQIGDTRPAPARRRRGERSEPPRRRREPKRAVAVGSGSAAPAAAAEAAVRPSGGQRRAAARASGQRRRQPQRPGPAGRGGGRRRSRSRPSSATTAARARRRDARAAPGGRERKGRPVGRYLMARARARPRPPRSPCSRAATSSSTTCPARPTTSPRSTATSTSARSRTCCPAWRRRSSTSARPRTPCSTAATSSYDPEDVERARASSARIEQILKAKQTIICQVTKNPIAHKGARLTQEVSLPGRFVVLIPNSDAPTASPSACPTTSASASGRSSTR